MGPQSDLDVCVGARSRVLNEKHFPVRFYFPPTFTKQTESRISIAMFMINSAWFFALGEETVSRGGAIVLALTSQGLLQLQQSNPWQSPPCRCCSCRWGRRTCQTFGLMLPQSASRRTACKCPWDQRGNSTDALKVLRVRIESTQCKRAGRRIRFYRSDHQIVSFL